MAWELVRSFVHAGSSFYYSDRPTLVVVACHEGRKSQKSQQDGWPLLGCSHIPRFHFFLTICLGGTFWKATFIFHRVNTSSTDWCLVNLSSGQWSRPRCSTNNVTGDCHPHSPLWSSERDLACSLPRGPFSLSFPAPSSWPDQNWQMSNSPDLADIYLQTRQLFNLISCCDLGMPRPHVTWTVSPFPPTFLRPHQASF